MDFFVGILDADFVLLDDAITTSPSSLSSVLVLDVEIVAEGREFPANKFDNLSNEFNCPLFIVCNFCCTIAMFAFAAAYTYTCQMILKYRDLSECHVYNEYVFAIRKIT